MEILWDIGRAAIVAALVASWQWFKHHWDIVTIAIAFGIPFILLLWRDWSISRHGIATPPSKDVAPTQLLSSPIENLARPVSRSAMEQQAFNTLRDDFACLKWTQKVAVKLICDGRASHQLSLVNVLDEMGFGDRNVIMEGIVKPISNCDLLSLKPDGVLTANPARLRDVEQIVNEWSAQSLLVASSDAPQRIATTLHLHYDDGRTQPRIVIQQNVRRWYSMATINQFHPKKGPTQEAIIITLFITFERPVAMKQLTVMGGRATTLPMYEVKDCNAWSAIVIFSGPILGDVEIEALL